MIDIQPPPHRPCWLFWGRLSLCLIYRQIFFQRITALQAPFLQLSPIEISPDLASVTAPFFSVIGLGTLSVAALFGFNLTSGVWSKHGLTSLADSGTFCLSSLSLAKSFNCSFKFLSSFFPVIDSGSSGLTLEWGPF